MTHRRRADSRIGAVKRADRRLGVCAALLVAVISLAIGVSVGAHADAAIADTPDPDLEGNLTVDITDGTVPSPSPTVSPPRSTGATPRPSSGSSSSTGSVTAVVTQATIPDPDAADEALGEEPVVSGGVLAMSGLSASASPSIAIGNGTLTVNFVIRNESGTAFDSTAEFWVDNAFGGRIAAIDDIPVAGLQPDETRRVQVLFEGLGQHIVLHVNATLIPPAEVEGATLEPLSRDTTVLVPPWFSILLVSAIAALSRLGWWLYSPRGLGLRFGRLGG